MNIRKRLLILAVGGVVPLLLVGLALLWSVWHSKQQQLNDGIEQQAELAAVLLDRWIDAQEQPLRTIAEYSSQNKSDMNPLQKALEAAMAPRPSWTDLRVLAADGKIVAMQPPNAESLPSGLTEKLLAGVQPGASVVATDWTKGEGQYSLVLMTPMKSGGVAVARIDGAALQEIFQGITLPERTVVTVMDPQRRIIYRSQRSQSALRMDLTGSNIASALNERKTAVVVLTSSVDNVERVYGLARAGNTGYSVSVGVPSSVLYGPAWHQVTVYVLVGLLVACGAAAAALLITQSIARPLRLLSLAAQKFGEGDFSARAPSAGDDEMSRLGVNFNAMAERLEKREARLAELDTLKSEWVSRVSHELRTPLTTIKALTRLLMREGLSEAKRLEYVETISLECDRQIELVLNLLDLARIEGGVFRITHERVDVDEVMSSCVKAGIRSAEKRGHVLRIEMKHEPLFVCADPKTIRRVLGNLIENSVKYTPDCGLIVLSAHGNDKEVIISVADNGRGIPAEDMPILFDKFYRGKPAPQSAAVHNSETEADFLEDADMSGVGLGLYLARNVMEQMGGCISVESEVGRGSIFSLHLPVWRDGGCKESVNNNGSDKTTSGR